MNNSHMAVFFFLYYCYIINNIIGSINYVQAYSATNPSTFYLGGSFPVYRKKVGQNYTTVKPAVERMAAFIAAVDAINADNTILPYTEVKYILTNGQLDEGTTIETSVDLMQCDQNVTVGAVIGPATSGNSKSSAHVFNSLHMPQISYSATSPDLSQNELYKYFLRTPPHDLFQANIIIDFLEDEVKARGITSFNLLVGPGIYAEAIGDMIKETYNFGNIATQTTSSNAETMRLARFDHFRDKLSADDTELKKQLQEFLAEDTKNGGCHVYVLSAQANDMKRVFDVANELGYNGDDKGRVQWILVEAAKASYGSINTNNDFNALNRIIQGSVVITPSDGRGTTSYNAFKSKVHGLGSSGTLCNPTHLNNHCIGLDATQCSNAVDANNKPIYYQDLPLDTKDKIPRKICLGMDYSNYGPSLYMPFTWDAVWSIANGLHSLVYEKNAIANASILINNKNERQQLYEELVNHVEFVGATGIVDFLNEAVIINGKISDGVGDRDGNNFGWNIDVHTANGFEIYGTVVQKQFMSQKTTRVKVRTSASLCYPPTKPETKTIEVNNTYFNSTVTIVVVVLSILIISGIIVWYYFRLKKLRAAHSNAWKIEKEQLNIIKTIGKGAYGTIYLGTYNSTRVAIKRFDKNAAKISGSMDDFIAEFEAIVDLRHNNLVQFFGAVLDAKLQHSIVTELMEKGDLVNVLHDPDNEFSPVQLAEFAHQISLGLEYLHQQKPNPIVHCDLKTENILVDAHDVCKIADFGLTVVAGGGTRNSKKKQKGSSKRFSHISKNSQEFETISSFKKSQKSDNKEGAKGSMLWLPPEVYSGGSYTKEGDVYALGLILSEICTLRTPFSQIDDKGANQIQRECALEDLRPVWGDNDEAFPSLKIIFDVATEMWQKEPEKRLHATNICERLGKIHQNLMKNNDSLRKQATHSTLLKNKSKKTVLIDDLLANRITTDESIKSVEFQDLQVFDSATENVSGNYYHRLKKGVLKGDIGVFALQLTFRLGKKEKRIKKNVGKAIDNLKQISTIKHQNLLEFIGVSHIKLTTINLLYSKPAASNYITLFDHISKPTTIFTMQDALKVTFDVVNTIMYLHKQNLYHCNLSCHTILIGADTKHILLSRWETTSITCKLHEEESIVLGKCGWESPESIILDHKGESCDIYAIGILLWYLMSHQLPFMEELKKLGGNKEQAVDTINRRIVNEEIRPNISIANIDEVAGIEHDNMSYIELISECWVQHMDERLSLDHVLKFLKKAIQKEPERRMKRAASLEENRKNNEEEEEEDNLVKASIINPLHISKNS